MAKITIPPLYIEYFDLKVFSISYGPNLEDCVRVVSFDTLSAISLFCSIYPDRDILNVLFLGDCVSAFPQK